MILLILSIIGIVAYSILHKKNMSMKNKKLKPPTKQQHQQATGGVRTPRQPAQQFNRQNALHG